MSYTLLKAIGAHNRSCCVCFILLRHSYIYFYLYNCPAYIYASYSPEFAFLLNYTDDQYFAILKDSWRQRYICIHNLSYSDFQQMTKRKWIEMKWNQSIHVIPQFNKFSVSQVWMKMFQEKCVDGESLELLYVFQRWLVKRSLLYTTSNKLQH